MANMQSAKKRARQTPKRTARNVQIKSHVKTAVRAAREAVLGNSKDAAATLKLAIATLGKAASKGTLHKRNVARRISRLAKLANKQAVALKTVAAVAPAAKAKTTKAKPAKTTTK